MNTLTHPADFLDSATTNARSTLNELPAISLRQLFGNSLPYAHDEKLPKSLVINPDHPLLSYTEREGYIFVSSIWMWMPVEHQAMLNTIRHELLVKSFPHGTGLGYFRGCRGPLCKRYRRQIEFDSAVLTAGRRRVLREERAKREDITLQIRPKRIYKTPFERLKTSNPPMAAVDPLIVLFCTREYYHWLCKLPRGVHEPWLNVALDVKNKREFLQENYGKHIN